MRIRSKIAAAATSGVMAAGALATFASQAHAATENVTTTIAGTITLTTPPVDAVLLPPTSLPGNATGTSALTVTSNASYHVTVKAAGAMTGTTTAHALSGGLALTPSMLVATGRTLTPVTLSTSDQAIISSPGGSADAVTLTFSQPVTASDPTDVYSTILTYTVSSGV